MEKTIDREDERTFYEPKIQSQRIKALYDLNHLTGKPVSELLDQAIQELAERHGTIYSAEEKPVVTEVKAENWFQSREYIELSDEMKYLKCLEELEKIKQEL